MSLAGKCAAEAVMHPGMEEAREFSVLDVIVVWGVGKHKSDGTIW